MQNLIDKLKSLPDRPGVYIMRDKYNEIIYIGKAVNLKNRVRQYFQSSRSHPPKVLAMVGRIADFEYIITDSELEALILECNLIKKHRPKYNILLKDDKHYPYIKVTVNEDFPRVLITREIKKDGARYFGPYTDSSAVNTTINLIKKLFTIRSCNKNIEKIAGKERPCLNYHIKRCHAPCQGSISSEDYKEIIKSVLLFLDGKQEELIKELEKRMENAAERLDFEQAAEIRDQINAVKKINEKQKMISAALIDQDIIAFAKDENETCVQVFFIRGGKLIGREHFFLSDTEGNSNEEIMSGFIKQFYNQTPFVPKEILLQEDIDELNIISSWLSSKKGSKVTISVPRRGDKHKLIQMACTNAQETLKMFLEKYKKDRERTIGACEELAKCLKLEEAPHRIEAFDISNIQGVDSVGSMIVFIDGKPSSKNYRRFRIKGVEGPNDYESMREIIRRRFEHGLKERKEAEGREVYLDSSRFAEFPDLIMMDGGLGQVNAALSVLKELNIPIPVCGMVKDDKHRTRGLIYEGEEINISTNTNLFRLVANIQDEAHRFAIDYHKSLRSKSTVKSVLDEIEGIGPARKKALLKHFGSIGKIKKASIEELAKVEGMNSKAAENVYEFFRKN